MRIAIARYGVYDRSYPNTYPYPNNNRNSGYGYNSVPYDNGYRDGLEKGREDAGDRDSYDPVRHSWYRSGDRGYNSRYGTKDSYKLAYRDGFEAGYDQAYRGLNGNGPAAASGFRFRDIRGLVPGSGFQVWFCSIYSSNSEPNLEPGTGTRNLICGWIRATGARPVRSSSRHRSRCRARDR